MRTNSDLTTTAVPLLFRYGVSRTSGVELPGHYDASSQLWVIETRDGFVSVVEVADRADLDTSTGTRVRQEGDDEDFSNNVGLAAAHVGTSTLTLVRQETDDEDISGDASLCMALLNTSTLTKVRQESADDDLTDDETIGTPRRLGALAELATKTDVQQESDDEINASTILELETRSYSNQEGSDDDFPPMLLKLQPQILAGREGCDDFPMTH